jgi:hypothetical protein
MAILGAAVQEAFAVGAVGCGVVRLSGLALRRDAIALDVAKVCPCGSEVRALKPDHARLDDDSPPPGWAPTAGGDGAVRATASRARAGEARAPAARSANGLARATQNAPDVWQSRSRMRRASAGTGRPPRPCVPRSMCAEVCGLERHLRKTAVRLLRSVIAIDATWRYRRSLRH